MSQATATPAVDHAPSAPAHATHHEPPTFFDKNHFPAHQFEDREQQHESTTLGMWAFLGTEVLLFAGCFLVFFVYRAVYHQTWKAGAHEMDVMLGTINTVVLLTSSLTVALAVRSAEQYKAKAIFGYLVVTIVLGFIFFGIKAVEYTHEIQKGLMPWYSWNTPFGGAGHHSHAPYPPQMRLFMYMYFIMTGLHAVHMVGGVSILAVIAWMAKRNKFAQNYNAVEMAGLYWHFVDIVWVFLFPTLYLLRT